jgi:hypothetical protein
VVGVKPDEALSAARDAAAAARARGAYDDDLAGFEVAPTDRVSTERLLEWAVIEPDIENVRSTRRLGGPITWVKRALVRALRQYLAEQNAQQTRFNLHVVIRIAELEERLERLERR